MANLQAGLTGAASVAVTADNTALNIKSGSLPVFATPAMCALMEEAACNAINSCLDADTTSVGVSLSIAHTAPSAIGSLITACAQLTAVEKHKLTFTVEARDEKGLIGRGTHERCIVNSRKFLSKLQD